MDNRTMAWRWQVAVATILGMLQVAANACPPSLQVELAGYSPEWWHVDCPYPIDATATGGQVWDWEYRVDGSVVADCNYKDYGVVPCGDPPSRSVDIGSVGFHNVMVLVKERWPYPQYWPIASASDYKAVYVGEVTIDVDNTALAVGGPRSHAEAELNLPAGGGCYLLVGFGGVNAQVEAWSAETGGTCLFGGQSAYPVYSKDFEFWIKGTGPTDNCYVQVQFVDQNGRAHPYGCVPPYTDLKVYYVDLEAVPAGNTPDLPAGQICTNAQAEYKKAKFRVNAVLPDGTAAASVTGGPVTLEPIGAADLNALESGDEFWAVGNTGVGSYTIELKHNGCSDAVDWAYGEVFKFELQKGTIGSLDIDVASYGTYPNYEYNPSGGNYSYHPTTSQTRDFWVDAVGGTYSGKVKLTATYKAYGWVEAMTCKSGYGGFSTIPGISFPIDGINASVTLPSRNGGARAAAGIGIHVPRDGGDWEDICPLWTSSLSWPWFPSDHQLTYPHGPAETPPLENTFASVGAGGAKGFTISTFAEVSIDFADWNKGQADVRIVHDEINDPAFAIVP